MEWLFVIPVTLTILLIICLWALIANEITFRQRMRRVYSLQDGDFWQNLKRLDSVTYNQHVWYVMTFRNPHKLYGK